MIESATTASTGGAGTTIQPKEASARLMLCASAVGALEQRTAALPSHARAVATCTPRCSTPTRFDPVGTACLLDGEPLLELDRRRRKIAPKCIVIVRAHHGLFLRPTEFIQIAPER